MYYQIFWGGHDVHPYFYGEKKDPQCGSTDCKRDIEELEFMQYCKTFNIPMIGVCRGAQLGAVFNRHKLHQHVTGHLNSNHPLFFAPNVSDLVKRHLILECGDHHQAIKHTVDGNAYELLAVGEDDLPEIVYYPETRFLAIQGHPEWDQQGDYKELCNTLIAHYLGIKEKVFK